MRVSRIIFRDCCCSRSWMLSRFHLDWHFWASATQSGWGWRLRCWLGFLISAQPPVVLVAATDFPEKPWMAYACLILFLIVRLLDDYVYLPLTVGRKLHVHPLLS